METSIVVAIISNQLSNELNSESETQKSKITRAERSDFIAVRDVGLAANIIDDAAAPSHRHLVKLGESLSLPVFCVRR